MTCFLWPFQQGVGERAPDVLSHLHVRMSLERSGWRDGSRSDRQDSNLWGWVGGLGYIRSLLGLAWLIWDSKDTLGGLWNFIQVLPGCKQPWRTWHGFLGSAWKGMRFFKQWSRWSWLLSGFFGSRGLWRSRRSPSLSLSSDWCFFWFAFLIPLFWYSWC